jgi:hypothetical protein
MCITVDASLFKNLLSVVMSCMGMLYNCGVFELFRTHFCLRCLSLKELMIYEVFFYPLPGLDKIIVLFLFTAISIVNAVFLLPGIVYFFFQYNKAFPKHTFLNLTYSGCNLTYKRASNKSV